MKNPIGKLSKWLKQRISIARILEEAEEELERELYGWITSAEANFKMKGYEKYVRVANKLFTWAIANGYGAFIPKLIPLVQQAVETIYDLKEKKEEVVVEIPVKTGTT